MLQGFFVRCGSNSLALAETTTEEQNNAQEWMRR